MILSEVTVSCSSLTASLSAVAASSSVMGFSCSLLAKMTFVSLPSSVRTSVPESRARNSSTSGGSTALRSNAFCLRMAIFVSVSGG